jgi:hypothetical protein
VVDDEFAEGVVGGECAGVANPSEVGAGGDEFEAARSVRHHRLEALLVDGDSLRLLPSPLGGVLEAGDAGDLPDRWGTDGDAIQDLQRLESGGFSGDDRTDAVAGDGEIFRERVQADDGVPPGRIIEEGVRRRVGGAKRAVGLVDDEGEIVRLRECGKLGDPLGWDGDSGGIAGADQDDGCCAFIDQRCARLGIRDQTVVVGDASSLDLLDVEPHAVVEVEGVLHEHVVAGSGECRCHDAERLVAAGGDEHVVGNDLTAVGVRQVGGEGRTQRRKAGLRRIGRDARVARRSRDRVDHDRWWRVRGCGLRHVEQRPSVDPMVDQRMSSADRGRHEIRDGRREAHRARVWPTS